MREIAFVDGSKTFRSSIARCIISHWNSYHDTPTRTMGPIAAFDLVAGKLDQTIT